MKYQSVYNESVPCAWATDIAAARNEFFKVFDLPNISLNRTLC